MLGNAFRALSGLAGCAIAGFGAWLMLDESVLPGLAFPRQTSSLVLIVGGAILILAAVWARVRSLLALLAVAGGTGLISWAILYADLNVWQLIPLWIAAFFGSFFTLVCLIAACRGKDVF